MPMSQPLFRSLTVIDMADLIAGARRAVCYAGPGIQIEAARAMAAIAPAIAVEMITVCLDFDERVFRMGFGSLEAVETLRGCGVEVRSVPGLRTGLLVVDEVGYIFTPTALYLEADVRDAEAPNAMRLSRDQVTEALARLSPAAKAIAIAFAPSEEAREDIRNTAVELASAGLEEADYRRVAQRLQEAPPARFDVARQVRVYEAILQYVEVKLTGAAIQRHRIAIPQVVQNLGGAENIRDKLRTTFDLLDRDSDLSSRSIESELGELRKNFTPSLGKRHGRVILKAQKPHFQARLTGLKGRLAVHRKEIESRLQGYIDGARVEIINYYLPRVMENPPDAFSGRLLAPPTPDDARRWLDRQLERVIPAAEALIQNMEIEETYRDLTFETLNEEGMLDALRTAFPEIDWQRTHDEFLAAAEGKPRADRRSGLLGDRSSG